MTYPRSSFGPAADVQPSPRFPDLEQQTLAFWADDDTFRASIAQRDGAQHRCSDAHECRGGMLVLVLVRIEEAIARVAPW